MFLSIIENSLIQNEQPKSYTTESAYLWKKRPNIVGVYVFVLINNMLPEQTALNSNPNKYTVAATNSRAIPTNFYKQYRFLVSHTH